MWHKNKRETVAKSNITNEKGNKMLTREQIERVPNVLWGIENQEAWIERV